MLLHILPIDPPPAQMDDGQIILDAILGEYRESSRRIHPIQERKGLQKISSQSAHIASFSRVDDVTSHHLIVLLRLFVHYTHMATYVCASSNEVYEKACVPLEVYSVGIRR